MFQYGSSSARVALCAMFALGACVTSPRNGEQLASRDSTVTFEGFGPAPRQLVYVEAAQTRRGPFHAWAGSSTRTERTPTQTIPVGRHGSLPLYAFSLNSRIPAEHWHTSTDADGCSVSDTFVRIRDAVSRYHTFDVGDEGLACLKRELTAGRSPREAFALCASADSPVMRLSTGATHHGDVVIDDAADVAALRCYEQIEGSLRVLSGAPNLISLPRLQRVTGDVELVYTSYRDASTPPGAYEAMRCGQLSFVTAEVRVYDVPALTTVGGDLRLRQEGSFSGPASTQAIDLGLNALASLGGSLSIETAQFGASPCGLTSLPSVPGDLTIRFGSGEVDSSVNRLLTALTRISGTLSLDGGHNASGSPMPLLSRVGGLHIRKDQNLSGFPLSSLTDVEGVAELDGVGSHGVLGPGSGPIGLARVGTLIVRNSTYESLEDIGGLTLALGGLELRDNPVLARLTSATGTSKVTLSPAANLTIASNPLLPASEICAFTALEAGLGWSGPSDLGGTTCP